MAQKTPETDEDEEEDIGVSYTAGNKGPGREDMVNEYLPEKDDWTAKTVLDLNDPGRVAVLRNIGRLFPECEHHQPVIDEFLDNFLKSRTSVAGKSRDEYQRIFESMYGGHHDDDKGSVLAEALAADLNEDD